MDKIKNGNTPNRAGRPKGSVNKTTAAAKAMIEQVAEGLGGAERMLTWAQASPDNEKAFWVQIYPKLLPLQVNGAGANGEHLIGGKVVWEVIHQTPPDR